MNPLAELLARLDSEDNPLTDAELGELEEGLLGAVADVRKDENLSQTERNDELSELADQIEKVRTIVKTRTEEAEKEAAREAELLARIGGAEAEEEGAETTTPDPEGVELAKAAAEDSGRAAASVTSVDGAPPPATPAPTEASGAEVVSQTVTAAIPPGQRGARQEMPDGSSVELMTPTQTPLRAVRRLQKLDRTPVEETGGVSIVAASNITEFDVGQSLTHEQVNEALISKFNATRSPHSGPTEFLTVAQKSIDYDDDRVFRRGDSPERIEEILREHVDRPFYNVTGPPVSLTAAGGPCVSPLPLYDIPSPLVSAERPWVRILPSFGAERAAVSFRRPVSLPDFSTVGIRVTTAAEDTAGYTSTAGTTADKPCARVTCDSPVSAAIVAIHQCLVFGNFQARFDPETIAQYTALSEAAQARVAEEFLMTKIVADSDNVTAALKLSAERDIGYQIDVALAAYRSRHRMAAGRRFTAVFPEWVVPMIRTSISNAGYLNLQDRQATDAEVNAWFSVRGVDVDYYKDESNPGGDADTKQVYGAQTAGALLTYKNIVRWFLFPTGTFVRLDAGTLDLGVVRDMSLIVTNDYATFAESFETVVRRGFQAFVIDSTVDASGIGSGVITSASGW